MVSFSYYSHTIPISLGSGMGMVCPLLGVPKNPMELEFPTDLFWGDKPG